MLFIDKSKLQVNRHQPSTINHQSSTVSPSVRQSVIPLSGRPQPPQFLTVMEKDIKQIIKAKY